MVDLGGGQDGPIEHGFSNSVFIIPGIVFVSLAGVQDVIQQEGNAETEPPSFGEADASVNLEKLLEIMQKLNLSDENEEQLRETLTQKAKMGMLGGFMPDALKNLDNISPEEPSQSYGLVYLLAFVFLILLVLVFFGYKLYKSHTDRERKREEKRRLKQQKKKK